MLTPRSGELREFIGLLEGNPVGRRPLDRSACQGPIFLVGKTLLAKVGLGILGI